ncbi:MAG TPA: hypothetical protein PLA46_06500 [Phycicoccus sp.]|jgi:anti-sigma factor RsiW|nr:hypothetical protein [Phycicoccus sp.]HQH07151.1 hypothetical protein [Phycicoccus sp.]HQK30139.1 hypothetical protein [Phycicoccus sp.]HQV91215.1 hypothetical protein [Phycicoccus sp.]HQY95571.1 hypothetical protein [Phycicoccus sp.]
MSGPAARLTSQAVQALLLDTEPWLSCEDCFHLLDQHVEAVLDPDARPDPAFVAHLAGCPACAEEAAALAALIARPPEG